MAESRRMHITAIIAGALLTSLAVMSGSTRGGATLWSIFLVFVLGCLLVYAGFALLWAARTCSQTGWVHVTALAMGALSASGWYSQALEEFEGSGISFSQLNHDARLSFGLALLGVALFFPMLIYLAAGLNRLGQLPKGAFHQVRPYAKSFAILVGMKMWVTGSASSSFAGAIFGLIGAGLAFSAAYLIHGIFSLFRGSSAVPAATESPKENLEPKGQP